MSALFNRAAEPTEEDRAQYFLNNRWQIPASEVPYSIDSFLAGEMVFRAYFTHTTNRVASWVCELKRGVVDLPRAVEILGKKESRRDIRKAINKYNLKVKVDHRFSEILTKCATTPHALPIFIPDSVTKELVFHGVETDPESGKALYYPSTWITPEIQQMWRDGYARGVTHSIGVFATDADGKEHLAAGSVLFMHNGTAYIATAFTEKKIIKDVSPEGTDTDAKRRFLTEVIYSNAGHVEEAASLLYLNHLGFGFLDSGLMYKGWGMSLYDGRTVPLSEFLQMKAANKARNIVVPASPADGSGIDITQLVVDFSAIQENPQRK